MYTVPVGVSPRNTGDLQHVISVCFSCNHGSLLHHWISALDVSGVLLCWNPPVHCSEDTPSWVVFPFTVKILIQLILIAGNNKYHILKNINSRPRNLAAQAAMELSKKTNCFVWSARFKGVPSRRIGNKTNHKSPGMYTGYINDTYYEAGTCLSPAFIAHKRASTQRAKSRRLEWRHRCSRLIFNKNLQLSMLIPVLTHTGYRSEPCHVRLDVVDVRWCGRGSVNPRHPRLNDILVVRPVHKLACTCTVCVCACACVYVWCVRVVCAGGVCGC